MTAHDEPPPDIGGRGARRRQQTRQRLLLAARTIFAREGLAEATIAHITQEADVGFGTFYLYFATKEDAYRAVASEGFADLAARLDSLRAAALSAGTPWWMLTRDLVATFYRFAAAERDLFIAMFAARATNPMMAIELQEQFAGQLAGLLRLGASGQVGSPAIYPYPPGPVALAVVVTLTRAAIQWLRQDTDQPADQEAPGEEALSLDSLIAMMSRFVIAALIGQIPDEAIFTAS